VVLLVQAIQIKDLKNKGVYKWNGNTDASKELYIVHKTFKHPPKKQKATEDSVVISRDPHIHLQ
jgi:uncharacterized protein involved in tolerance to divalent cations